MVGLAGFWLVCFDFWVVWLVFGWFRILAITHIGVTSIVGAKSEIQTKCMEGLVDNTLLSQKIKAICERLRFKLSVAH